MAKTSQEIENEFIGGLKSTTGKDLKVWLKEINDSGIEKRNDIIKWLKMDMGFGHMNASLLAGMYFNDGKPVYGSSDSLLDNQFVKNEDMRPLYEYLISSITNWDTSLNFVVKKTYVSVTKKREFAAINIRKGGLRLGMDLGEMAFAGRVEKSKLTGPMARISHMIVIRNKKEIDDKIFELLTQADQRVNN